MDPSWYLRKYDDGGIFGPLPFDQLSRWASKARVAPRDLVSSDQETWMKAPMLTELGMDWLVEVTSERYYGPTTLGAINEFVRLGEVTPENFIINTRDGSRRKIQEITPFLPTLIEESVALPGKTQTPAGSISGISSKLCSHRRAYFPPNASNCSWVPRSMMRP